MVAATRAFLAGYEQAVRDPRATMTARCRAKSRAILKGIEPGRSDGRASEPNSDVYDVPSTAHRRTDWRLVQHPK